ncbi:unnamed protein product [Amoebophrya sp. A25]|nr:unnamed protein product [Amoebophrya sp. A25]|eukprot:GSA25T00008447001.1
MSMNRIKENVSRAQLAWRRYRRLLLVDFFGLTVFIGLFVFGYLTPAHPKSSRLTMLRDRLCAESNLGGGDGNGDCREGSCRSLGGPFLDDGSAGGRRRSIMGLGRSATRTRASSSCHSWNERIYYRPWLSEMPDTRPVFCMLGPTFLLSLWFYLKFFRWEYHELPRKGVAYALLLLAFVLLTYWGLVIEIRVFGVAGRGGGGSHGHVAEIFANLHRASGLGGIANYKQLEGSLHSALRVALFWLYFVLLGLFCVSLALACKYDQTLDQILDNSGMTLAYMKNNLLSLDCGIDSLGVEGDENRPRCPQALADQFVSNAARSRKRGNVNIGSVERARARPDDWNMYAKDDPDTMRLVDEFLSNPAKQKEYFSSSGKMVNQVDGSGGGTDVVEDEDAGENGTSIQKTTDELQATSHQNTKAPDNEWNSRNLDRLPLPERGRSRMVYPGTGRGTSRRSSREPPTSSRMNMSSHLSGSGSGSGGGHQDPTSSTNHLQSSLVNSEEDFRLQVRMLQRYERMQQNRRLAEG